jgi:hypothetical protein
MEQLDRIFSSGFRNPARQFVPQALKTKTKAAISIQHSAREPASMHKRLS